MPRKPVTPAPAPRGDLLEAAAAAVKAWKAWDRVLDVIPTLEWLDAMDELQAAVRASQRRAKGGAA